MIELAPIVLSRYDRTVNRVYALIERIGNLLRALERRAAVEAGLQPVHVAMLGYLAEANRYSDHPVAVAEFLGLTKGTVSQSLIRLEQLGYLEKVRDERDARKTHLRLTRKARRLLERVQPPALFLKAFGEMPARERDQLVAGLEELLRHMQRLHGLRTFGVCRTCRFFRQEDRLARCGLTGEALSVVDSERICRDHQPG